MIIKIDHISNFRDTLEQSDTIPMLVVLSEILSFEKNVRNFTSGPVQICYIRMRNGATYVINKPYNEAVDYILNLVNKNSLPRNFKYG